MAQQPLKTRAERPVERRTRASEAAAGLDPLIHDRMRLGILSALAVNESIAFTELRGLLKTSDGNLSVHARKLEEAGYIKYEKSFAGRMPHTEYQLTASGRRALQRYLAEMEQIIEKTRI